MSLQTRPALFFVSLLACSIPLGVIAAEPAASAETGSKDKPPLIIHNPDGTMTAQKSPAPGKANGARNGLVIPPQVIVPTMRPPAKESGN